MPMEFNPGDLVTLDSLHRVTSMIYDHLESHVHQKTSPRAIAPFLSGTLAIVLIASSQYNSCKIIHQDGTIGWVISSTLRVVA